MIPVVFLSLHEERPNHGYWDYNFMEQVLEGVIWSPVYELKFNEYYHIEDVPLKTDGIVLVFPARYHIDDMQVINQHLARFKWAVVIAMNDEEGLFEPEMITHPNVKIWQMTPRTDKMKEGIRYIGDGYPPDSYMIADYEKQYYEKPNDWFFSGQITTPRREAMDKVLNRGDFMKKYKHVYNKTDGFTKGLDHQEYYKQIASSKVAICPTGAVTPDTLRLYEALEAGCFPITDDISPVYTSIGFFDKMYPGHPLAVVRSYSDLPGYIEDALGAWPANANKTYSWWQNYKRDVVYDLQRDVQQLANIRWGEPYYAMKDAITVVIPTSPIKSHPSTEIIEETIATIRHHLPKSEIFITFDGVREEQEDRRADYEEFTRRMLWKCNFEYKNVLPILFTEHTHQVGMMRAVMDKIETPLLLYVEADTPLTPDREIDWKSCVKTILDGVGDVVRFHFESVIPEPHQHLMHGTVNYSGMTYMRTSQWSQRPHLASVAYYKRIMQHHFSENAKSFIEDKMHGVVANAYNEDSMLGWQQHRVLIYYPKDNIKRSYTTDGRAGEAKYDDKQVF